MRTTMEDYMNDYIISSETSCDLPESYYESGRILSIPLYYTFDEATVYGDEKKLSEAEFYGKLRDGKMPKTMASNLETVLNLFRSVLNSGKDLIHVSFSSALSSSYNNAMLAAELLRTDYPERKIEIVDSLSASLGQGLLIDAALRKMDEGYSFEELFTWLEENKLRLCHVFTVDDLHFLQHGGRISKATAVLGSLINVKPVLRINDEGQLVSLANVRGRKKALLALVDRMAETVGDSENTTVFISHGDCLEDAKTVGRMVTERFGITDIRYGYVGTAIGSHSGPGTVSLFFFGEHR